MRAAKSNKNLGSGALSALEWLLLDEACKVIPGMSFSIELVLQTRINFADNVHLTTFKSQQSQISGAVVCRQI
jgi:hypothetical protein